MFGKLFSLFRSQDEMLVFNMDEDFEELEFEVDEIDAEDFFEDPNVIRSIKYH